MYQGCESGLDRDGYRDHSLCHDLGVPPYEENIPEYSFWERAIYHGAVNVHFRHDVRGRDQTQSAKTQMEEFWPTS